MSVYKKTKNGKPGKYYYYDFEFNGKRYHKSSRKTTEAEALVVERDVKKSLEDRHRRCLKDGGSDISLIDAVELAIEKPGSKPRQERQNNHKRRVWADFMAWLTENFTEVKLLNEVTRPIAEGYVNYIRRNGAFVKEVKQKGRASYTLASKLSHATLNGYHKELQWVFQTLYSDAGLDRNPFTHIKKLKLSKVKREAYSNEEISLIEANVDSAPFNKHLYYIGSYTGMRMGNICMLDWSDVDMTKRLIKCENLKTGGKLTIPILPPLYNYLQFCQPLHSGFVSSEHAERYQNEPAYVSSTFTNFLNSLGINTKVKVKGRSRASNTKGIHAMRHTFIYRAMLAKIPFNVIQCIVGHVDADITKMYADHVAAEDAQRAMAGFSILEADTETRQILHRISNRLTEMNADQLQDVLTFIEGMSNKRAFV